MFVYTLVTEDSSREILKEKKYLKLYSLKNLESGDMIEIVRRKKVKAIILKKESAVEYRYELRKRGGEISKIIFSKTGEWANGKVIKNFNLKEINKFLKNPEKIKTCKDEKLREFFAWVFRKRKNKFLKKEENKVKNGSVEELSNLLSFEKIIKKPKIYNSEIQELVDEVRKYFGEVAVKGQGSFSYYIGFFKKIPLSEIRRFFAEVKQSRKSTFDKKKLFWWKIGRYLKDK